MVDGSAEKKLAEYRSLLSEGRGEHHQMARKVKKCQLHRGHNPVRQHCVGIFLLVYVLEWVMGFLVQE